MKITGIIAEYNPFHNGHEYHLEQTRKRLKSDYIVVVMSGNYVQRGAPTIIDKYSRAEMVLKAGADLVLELPTCFATASAEYFAYGGVAILDKLHIVDDLEPLIPVLRILDLVKEVVNILFGIDILMVTLQYFVDTTEF